MAKAEAVRRQFVRRSHWRGRLCHTGLSIHYPLLLSCYTLRVENYFNYFTEIEEHFQRRRGSVLLLSTLDWALIETWKDAGIPLEAVLRGIDAAFERWERRRNHTRKVNGLAYCSQEVLAAAEEMKEAAVGAHRHDASDAGLQTPEVAAFLLKNAEALEREAPTGRPPLPTAAVPAARDTAKTLRELAASVAAEKPSLEDLERHLTVLEERLFAVLLGATPDEQLLAVRADADRELAPYRRNMTAPQIEQLQRQYVHKRLLERYGLPRLSLFYM